MHTNGALTVDIYFKDDPSGIVLSDVRAGSLEEASDGGGGSSYKKKGSRDELICRVELTRSKHICKQDPSRISAYSAL